MLGETVTLTGGAEGIMVTPAVPIAEDKAWLIAWIVTIDDGTAAGAV